MQQKRHNFGFTLLELVLVMAIIATICAMAAPSLRGFTRGRVLPNTATELAATARWCRVKAISDGLTYRLNFDPAGRFWWCSKDDGSGLKFTEITDDDMGSKKILNDDVSLEQLDLTPIENELYVSFDPAGKTIPATFRIRYQTNWIDITCDTPLSSYRVVPPNVSQPL